MGNRIVNYPGGLASFGIPLYGSLPMIKGTWFFIDPLKGSDTGYNGKSIKTPFATLKKAYDACTSWYGDGICFLEAGSSTSTTSNQLTAVLDWTKYGITVVGVAAPTGIFTRARIINATAVLNLAYLIDVQGSNNRFYNINLTNEGTAAAALGCLIVSGARNYFNNCYISGGNDATGPGDETGCNSLDLRTSECTFDDCTFGNNSTVHAAANAPIFFTTTQQGQNLFRGCRVYQKSSTSGAGGIKIVGATTMNGWTTFTNCTFQAFGAAGGASPGLTKVVIGDAQNDCGVHLHNCGEVGWLAWSVLASKVYVSCAGETAAGAGGIGSAPAA